MLIIACYNYIVTHYVMMLFGCVMSVSDLSNKEGTMFLEKAKSYTKLIGNGKLPVMYHVIHILILSGHINPQRSLKLRHSSSRSSVSHM